MRSNIDNVRYDLGEAWRRSGWDESKVGHRTRKEIDR